MAEHEDGWCKRQWARLRARGPRPFVVAGVIVAACVVVVVMARGDAAFIDYLRLLLSWPVVIGLLGGVALWRFHRNIADLLDHIDEIRWRGGRARIQPSPPAEAAEEMLPDPDTRGLEEELGELAAEAAGADAAEEKKKKRLIQVALGVLAEKEAVISGWRCAYLSLFFVTLTKQALGWIASHPDGVTRNTFYFRGGADSSIDARRTILHALLSTGVVSEESSPRQQSAGDVFTITPAGHDFLNYERGFGRDWGPYPTFPPATCRSEPNQGQEPAKEDEAAPAPDQGSYPPADGSGSPPTPAEPDPGE